MAEETTRKFELRKIYIKDMSFESPLAPHVFRTSNTTPTVDIQLNVGHQSLGESMYESVLTVTVNGKLGEKDAFLVEVHQAGVYEISGVEPEKGLQTALEVSCPNMLFPFAREAVNDLVVRGGFPQLLLSPVNFEYLYRQKNRNQSENPQDGENTGNGDAGKVPASDPDGASS